MAEVSTNEFWVVYDGDCPMCSSVATAYRLRDATGSLMLLDARSSDEHPLIQKINNAGLDLDEGFVISYADKLYHGAEAVDLMWLMSSRVGWLNKLNAWVFKSPKITRFLYPFFKAVRNSLLFVKRSPQIQNLTKPADDPIFKPVFGAAVWDELPQVLQDHYDVRAGSEDRVEMHGLLDVEITWFAALTLKLTGALVPEGGTKVPVTVLIYSAEDRSNALVFDREFAYSEIKKHRFKSYMYPTGNGQVVEVVKFGLGWRHKPRWDGTKLHLEHIGYSQKIFGKFIPIPLTWLMGKSTAFEQPMTSTKFAMSVDLRTRFLGKRLAYSGEFEIVKKGQTG